MQKFVGTKVMRRIVHSNRKLAVVDLNEKVGMWYNNSNVPLILPATKAIRKAFQKEDWEFFDKLAKRVLKEFKKNNKNLPRPDKGVYYE